MRAYNRDQWQESFEGRLSILRPHLSPRLLSTMSGTAWSTRGAKGEDPIKVADAVSKELETRAKGKR